MKRTRVTLVPIVIATAAFFMVLPRSGGDARLRMVGDGSGFSYAPATVEIAEGARILIVNETGTTHTVTSTTGEFDVQVQPGDSRFLELDDTGAYDFYCRFHGSSDGMTGSVRVGDPSAIPSSSPSPSPSALPTT